MTGGGDWNGNRRGEIRLTLRERRVRCAGKKGRARCNDLTRNRSGLRDRQRRR